MTKLDQVAQDALTLSSEEKLTLIDRLLASIDPAEQAEIDAAWAEEAERRIDEYEDGGARGTPAEEVFRELRRRRADRAK